MVSKNLVLSVKKGPKNKTIVFKTFHFKRVLPKDKVESFKVVMKDVVFIVDVLVLGTAVVIVVV